MFDNFGRKCMEKKQKLAKFTEGISNWRLKSCYDFRESEAQGVKNWAAYKNIVYCTTIFKQYSVLLRWKNRAKYTRCIFMIKLWISNDMLSTFQTILLNVYFARTVPDLTQNLTGFIKKSVFIHTVRSQRTRCSQYYIRANVIC